MAKQDKRMTKRLCHLNGQIVEKKRANGLHGSMWRCWTGVPLAAGKGATPPKPAQIQWRCFSMSRCNFLFISTVQYRSNDSSRWLCLFSREAHGNGWLIGSHRRVDYCTTPHRPAAFTGGIGHCCGQELFGGTSSRSSAFVASRAPT